MTTEFEHHRARINGIQQHVVALGEGAPVVLCHGFPHTWFVWHRQMRMLAEAGYRAIAPDMRGMGETEAPADVEAYGIHPITADLTGWLDHFGVEQATFVGIDFGAFAVYDLAMIAPERVRAVIGLQNPTPPHIPGVPTLTHYREMAQQHFLHIEYFRPEGIAEADLDPNARSFLHQVYFALSGAYDYAEVLSQPPGITYREALPEPPPLPWSWLAEDEFDVIAQSYERSGFRGGLNWYRSMDVKWRDRTPLEGKSSEVPAYFIGSEKDLDLAHFHGQDPIGDMRRQFPDLRRVEMVPAVGHLMHLEATEAVNVHLRSFLAEI